MTQFHTKKSDIERCYIYIVECMYLIYLLIGVDISLILYLLLLYIQIKEKYIMCLCYFLC